MLVLDQLSQLLGVILLPSKVAESMSPTSTSGMLRVTDECLLPNTATLAVGTVFHMTSPSLVMEFSPKPGAVKQHQQLATASTRLSSSSSIPPPVQPRVMLTPTTSWSWRNLGAQETDTPSWMQAKMMPTRALMSDSESDSWQASLTLILSQ